MIYTKQTYRGVQLVEIPSGMGGTLPAAVAARLDGGEVQVICLHPEYFPNFLLSVKATELQPFTYTLTSFAKECIDGRLNGGKDWLCKP